MSESSHKTHEVEGPRVVKRREFLALDIAARRAFWFSILWRSASVCETKGGSKSCLSMMILANRFFFWPRLLRLRDLFLQSCGSSISISILWYDERQCYEFVRVCQSQQVIPILLVEPS